MALLMAQATAYGKMHPYIHLRISWARGLAGGGRRKGWRKGFIVILHVLSVFRVIAVQCVNLGETPR